MTDRQKFHWDVQVADAEDGSVKNTKVHAFWDPKHYLTEQSVLTAAATQVGRETGRKYVGMTCKLVS